MILFFILLPVTVATIAIPWFVFYLGRHNYWTPGQSQAEIERGRRALAAREEVTR